MTTATVSVDVADFDVYYKRISHDGTESSFHHKDTFSMKPFKIECSGLTEAKALAYVEKAQAHYTNQGFNPETGYFWAHNGAPHQRPDHVAMWWLRRRTAL